MPSPNNTPGILYEVSIKFVMHSIDGGNRKVDLSQILKNGRGSYLIFQSIAAAYAGLTGGTEGKGSDLVMEDTDDGYEVKSYHDPADYPREDEIHCGPSGLFANNSGAKEYKGLLREKKYAAAMELAHKKGYSKNDYYLFTNTSKFKSDHFRYLIISRDDLVKIVNREDPVTVSRSRLLATATKRVKIA